MLFVDKPGRVSILLSSKIFIRQLDKTGSWNRSIFQRRRENVGGLSKGKGSSWFRFGFAIGGSVVSISYKNGSRGSLVRGLVRHESVRYTSNQRSTDTRVHSSQLAAIHSRTWFATHTPSARIIIFRLLLIVRERERDDDVCSQIFRGKEEGRENEGEMVLLTGLVEAATSGSSDASTLLWRSGIRACETPCT